MALADIIARIEADAATEADAILATAHERAEAVVASAREKAAAHRAEVTAAARRDAARDAETIVVNARLAGRDALVTQRRGLVEEALVAAAARISEMPDDEYARFLAGRIARVARGGERVTFGVKDASRAASILARVGEIAPSLALMTGEADAPFDHGALLEGPRVRADLSLATIVADGRDELELIAVAALFGEEA